MELWQLHFKDPVSVLIDPHGQVKPDWKLAFVSIHLWILSSKEAMLIM